METARDRALRDGLDAARRQEIFRPDGSIDCTPLQGLSQALAKCLALDRARVSVDFRAYPEAVQQEDVPNRMAQLAAMRESMPIGAVGALAISRPGRKPDWRDLAKALGSDALAMMGSRDAGRNAPELRQGNAPAVMLARALAPEIGPETVEYPGVGSSRRGMTGRGAIYALAGKASELDRWANGVACNRHHRALESIGLGMPGRLDVSRARLLFESGWMEPRMDALAEGISEEAGLPAFAVQGCGAGNPGGNGETEEFEIDRWMIEAGNIYRRAAHQRTHDRRAPLLRQAAACVEQAQIRLVRHYEKVLARAEALQMFGVMTQVFIPGDLSSRMAIVRHAQLGKISSVQAENILHAAGSGMRDLMRAIGVLATELEHSGTPGRRGNTNAGFAGILNWQGDLGGDFSRVEGD